MAAHLMMTRMRINRSHFGEFLKIQQTRFGKNHFLSRTFQFESLVELAKSKYGNIKVENRAGWHVPNIFAHFQIAYFFLIWLAFMTASVDSSMMPSQLPSTQSQGRIFAQFRSPEGEMKGPQLEIPLDLSPKQLNAVLNELLGNERSDPYSFYVNDQVDLSPSVRPAQSVTARYS